jgi:O-antigen/teichoic acid export membrane protein
MTTMTDTRRAGMIVLASSVVLNVGNYLFYVVAARMVSPVDFAAIAALITFGNIAMMPVNGMQMAVARDVALLRTSGTAGELSAYIRRLTRRTIIICAVIVVAIGAASPIMSDKLHIGGAYPIALAAGWIAATAMLNVLTGVMQGMERFSYVAFTQAGPSGMFRTLLLPLCILAAGMAGSMWAILIAALIGVAVVARPVIRQARVEPTKPPALPSMVSTMTVLLAFSSLTSADVLFAQAGLVPIDRAHYASAVLLGKIALYAPQALALVLLPAATAAVERGERAEKAVLVTMGLTAACGLAVAGVLWVLPSGVLTLTFGPAYSAAKPLLAPLALVMTAAAVLLVHVTFATAKRSNRMTVALVVAAVAHWILLSFLHHSPWQIITASAIAIGTTLVVIEIGSGSGIVRMLLNRPKALTGP